MAFEQITHRLKGWRTRGPIDPTVYVGDDEAKNEQVVRAGFVAKAKRYLKYLPIAREAVAMYFCMLDSKTPLWVKGVVAAALAYFVLPFDAIPDFIPVVGLGDDAGVLAATLSAVSAYVTDEHRARATEWIEQEHIATAPEV